MFWKGAFSVDAGLACAIVDSDECFPLHHAQVAAHNPCIRTLLRASPKRAVTSFRTSESEFQGSGIGTWETRELSDGDASDARGRHGPVTFSDFKRQS